MKEKSRYQPSKTVEALFTTAVVKIKADANKAIAKQKAMSETEPVSAKAGVEAKTDEPVLEQKVEPEVETEAAIETSAVEPGTESVEQTTTNETKSEAETEEALVESKAEEKIEGEAVKDHIQSQEELQEEQPVSQKETEETLDSEAEEEVKAEEPILEQKVEPEVETEAAIETSEIEPETESVGQTATNETKSEAETEEALVESKAEEKIEGEAVKDHIQSQEELQEEEPVSQKETEETLESEAEEEVKAEEDEQKTEGADADVSEDVAEEKVEITTESQEPAEGEVSKTIQQVTQSQPNQLSDELMAASDLCAKNVMQREFVWGSPEDSVQQTLAMTKQHNTGYILIGQNGVLEGLVSESDLAGAISPYLKPVFAKWRRPLDDATLQIRVKWIMSRIVHTINPQTPLAAIMSSMCRFRVLCLPVVDQQGKVQGVVTEADIFNVLINLKSSPNLSASGDKHQEKPTSDNLSDHREIESTPTMEPDLVAPV